MKRVQQKPIIFYVFDFYPRKNWSFEQRTTTPNSSCFGLCNYLLYHIALDTLSSHRDRTTVRHITCNTVTLVWVKVSYDWPTAPCFCWCLCQPRPHLSKLQHKHKHKHKKNKRVRSFCAYAYVYAYIACFLTCLMRVLKLTS